MLDAIRNHPFYQKILTNTASTKGSLCIGLDPDLKKLPPQFEQSLSGVQTFLTEIIRVSQDLCIAYKPNISFFEAMGIDGLKLLESLRKSVPAHTPWIIDAKRGDIGNTSAMQASFLYDVLGADAVTLHPYMGTDSLEPFFAYKQGFNFVLALTSNPGAEDFEMQTMQTQKPLYLTVAEKCAYWNNRYHNVGMVVGATHQQATLIREQDADMLYLVPGVGAQGGAYGDTKKRTQNRDGLSLINMSRGILYTPKLYEPLADFETIIRATISDAIQA